MKNIELVTLICAFGSLLVGGVFYGFSTFVMGALGAIEPRAGIAAMQSINIVVKNVWFLAFLFGLMLPCGWLTRATWGDASTTARLQLAGSLLYLVGSIGVTVLCNVPRNDALAVVDPASAAGLALWRDYVPSWTFWNHVRCAACCGSSCSPSRARTKCAPEGRGRLLLERRIDFRGVTDDAAWKVHGGGGVAAGLGGLRARARAARASGTFRTGRGECDAERAWRDDSARARGSPRTGREGRLGSGRPR